MTTIVYDHKARHIAVDGRVTAGDLICSDNFQKWRFVGDEVWFMSGVTADYQRLIDYHAGVLSGNPQYSVSCSAVVAAGGECYECGVTAEGEPWRSVAPYSIAIGSGRDHAITALDMGADAKSAVEFAAKRNTPTGGTITVFDLAAMQFIEAGQ
jgi:ATP-dependent protease HslVU (ClpYQ) peptidase subunit